MGTEVQYVGKVYWASAHTVRVVTVTSITYPGVRCRMILQRRRVGFYGQEWIIWCAMGARRREEMTSKTGRAGDGMFGVGNDRRTLIGMRISGMVAHRMTWTH